MAETVDARLADARVAAHEDQLPLLTAPAPRPLGRRTLLLASLLLFASGMSIYVFWTTESLLDTASASANKILHIVQGTVKHPALGLVEGTNFTEYTCVGWRQTGSCSPDGPRESDMDKSCSANVTHSNSGYCEIEHKTTGERRRVLPMQCTSLSTNGAFRCDQFVELLQYGDKATEYSHDSNFSYANNQEDFLALNSLRVAPSASFFHRGIVMVVYERVLLSAYVSIRSLREQVNSTLPVEMWYRKDEMDPNHPLLQTLVTNYSVYLREMKDPLATGFYTKLHAVFYSAFDSVLLLDADNYAVKDPSYLFDTHEFTSNGAIFWPDFWKAGNTLFNIHADSVVWEIFALSFVDMFEQESGQVLIDRRRHFTALNALMYYGFSLPRIPEQIEVVWGDKDLFRFAWLKTNSTFHMIARPPGTAGKFNSMTKKYCGLTMVQHDPEGKIVFLHRNVEKILKSNREPIWTHVQQFKEDAPLTAYRVEWAKVYEAYRSCWGQALNWKEHYTLNLFADLFGNFETELLRFADEGAPSVADESSAAAPEETKRQLQGLR